MDIQLVSIVIAYVIAYKTRQVLKKAVIDV